MEHTYSWTDGGQGETLPDPAVRLIQALAAEAHVAGLIQRAADDSRPPWVTPHEILFNGIEEQAGQPFHYATTERGALCVCRTRGRPYSAVVRRVLLVLGHYRPGLAIRSSGDLRREWAAAMHWFNAAVGHVYVDEHLAFYHSADELMQLRAGANV